MWKVSLVTALCLCLCDDASGSRRKARRLELSDDTLRVLAGSVEYGPLSQDTHSLYGWDIILEADKDVVLKVVNPRADSTYDFDVRHHSDERTLAAVQSSTDGEVNLRCLQAGVQVHVTVTEQSPQGTRTYATENAVCKRVRREVRRLTQEDREKYLEALNTFYRVPLHEGKNRFGKEFVNNPFVVAVHATDDWCLHNTNQFMVVHSAFMNWGDNLVRMIDSEAPFPYWDNMVEFGMGPDWRDETPVFTADYFGDFGTQESNWTISQGRFAQMEVASMQDEYKHYHPGTDEWGYITKGFTLNNNPYVVRGSKTCGADHTMRFSPPENLFQCYDYHDHWESAIECVYDDVHGQLHTHLAGSSECAADLGELYRQHHPTYSRDLLAFVATIGKFEYAGDYMEHHRECEKPQDGNGHCSCKFDADTVSEHKLYSFMLPSLEDARDTYPGKTFVVRDDDGKLRFSNSAGPLADEDNQRLMRAAAKIWCSGAVDAHFTTFASVNDPIFWASHTWFDRMSHFLHTSPELKDRGFNFEWSTDNRRRLDDDDGDDYDYDDDDDDDDDEWGCRGNKYDDKSPFRHFYMVPGSGNRKLLTMRQLDEMLHPQQVELPYVYEDLRTYGNQQWQPRSQKHKSTGDEY